MSKCYETGLAYVGDVREPSQLRDTRVSLLELRFRKRTPVSVWRTCSWVGEVGGRKSVYFLLYLIQRQSYITLLDYLSLLC